jgi:hypothetical protein
MVIMTTRGRAVVLVVALALAASLLTLAAVLAKPAQAQQVQTFTDTDQSPFSFTVEGCTEPVFLEGTFYTVAHTTIDANGGFHSKFQFRLTGQGEGLSSGDKYVFNTMLNEDRNSPMGATEAELTFTQTSPFKLIRQGSATPTDDQQGKFLNHITVNAQGEVTARFLNAEFVCT